MEGLLIQGSVAGIVRNIAPDELTFAKAIELFETIYMASRNLVYKTRVGYKADVEELASFLAGYGITKPANVGLADLQGFLAMLDAKGLTGTTRRRKSSSIRTFFGFLATSDIIPHNPTQQLVPPERDYKEPRYLTR